MAFSCGNSPIDIGKCADFRHIMSMRKRLTSVAAWVLPGVLLVAVGALLLIGQEIATRRAVNAEASRARASAVLLASSFRRELEKFRLVSVVLAQDREAQLALQTRDPARLRALDRKLEALSTETSAAVVYLLDNRGFTVAASNWRRPDSFVGASYAFRAYFKDAMVNGQSQQFALGTRSRRPGVYVANRLGGRTGALGVFVVKIEFDALEAEWRQSGNPAFASNQSGIILVTSVPEWRFQTTAILSEARREQIRRNLEFGAEPLVRNRLFATSSVAPAGSPNAYSRPYIEAVEEAPDGWSIHVLASTVQPVAVAVNTVRLVMLTGILAGVGFYLWWRHRRRVATARAEALVTQRLDVLNQRLAQATKLATLGQVAAGVGHEINQPVAAISTYAHSARTLIAHGQAEAAIGAIDRIAALTVRIGIITRELRGFSRRTSQEIGPVVVAEAVEGALLLLRDRVRTGSAQIEDLTQGSDVRVIGEHARLEQVLVNLVANALDAGATHIRVVVEQDEGVTLSIADDGPGLSAEARAGLFQPFTTSKIDGLGLGLVICRDIAVEFGGDLVAASPPKGAEFLLRLRRAP